MITYTEKERKWILSDPGEISRGIGGRLQPSITPSMFIESPSSLDLMLGMQKQPSWDCGFTDTSTVLESKQLQPNVRNFINPPHQKRKRKASWSGGFEDQEKTSKSDIAKNEPATREGVGYSSVSKKICNVQIQYGAKTEVLVETVQMERSLFTEYGPGTDEFFPLKKPKIRPDDVETGNSPRQRRRQIKGKTKVPKIFSSIATSRRNKRTKKVEDNELEEATQEEFSRNVQGLKVTANIAELLMSNERRVEKKNFSMTGRTQNLSTTLADQTIGILALPSVSGYVSQNIVSLENQDKEDLQVGTLTTKSLSTTRSLGVPKRRIKIVRHHGLEDMSLASTEQTKTTRSSSSSKKEVVSQRANHVEKLDSQNNCQEKLLSDDVTPPLPLEKTRGSAKRRNLQGIQIPRLVLRPLRNNIDNNDSIRKSPDDGPVVCNEGFHPGPQRFALPLSGEDSDIETSDEAFANDDLEDIHATNEDFDPVEGGNVRVKVTNLLQLFRDIHKAFKGGHKELDVRNIIVGCYQEYLVNGSESLYGDVPGVKAGDTFKYRVEMDLVGLHHQLRKGIDVIAASKSKWRIQGKPVSIAACIVVAGGYVDNRDEGDVIIYTGEGGNNFIYDKGPSKDQMLTYGNKALRHSMMLGLYVRVVRKIDMKPPTKPYYRYDGLYEVMEMKKERTRGHRRKSLSLGEEDDKHRISKCKKLSFKPLVYKFVLVRKSKKEKYKNVNLWNCKPSSSARALKKHQQRVLPSSSINAPIEHNLDSDEKLRFV